MPYDEMGASTDDLYSSDYGTDDMGAYDGTYGLGDYGSGYAADPYPIDGSEAAYEGADGAFYSQVGDGFEFDEGGVEGYGAQGVYSDDDAIGTGDYPTVPEGPGFADADGFASEFEDLSPEGDTLQPEYRSGGASVADILAGAVEVAPYDATSGAGDQTFVRRSFVRDGSTFAQTASDGASAAQPSDFAPLTRIVASPPDVLDEMDEESEAAVAALEERRSKRRRRRIIVAVVVVLLLAGGGTAAFFLLSRGGGSLPDDVDALPPATITVEREDFTSEVTTQGALQPVDSKTVVPTVDGTISQIYVQEGDMVVEGDQLFTIRNETLEKAVSDATVQYNAANSAVQRANDTYTQAYNDYNAAVASYNAGLIDETSVRAYEAAVTSAESARAEASSAATAASKALDDARDALDKCTVTAPISGTVVAINQEVDATGANSPSTANMSIQIADLSQMKVVVQVNEMDIAAISVGQTADVTFSALPDIELEAVVDSVASSATGDSMGGGIVTFGVTLLISAPDPELKPGMTANVTIMTEDVPHALVIPLGAVSFDSDDTSVGTVWLVSDPDTFASVPRTVRLGARDTMRVVVTSGLKEGDTILLSSADEEGASPLEYDDAYESGDVDMADADSFDA